MSDTSAVIAKRLKKARQDQGWNLRETAEKMGFKHISRYSNWELELRVPKLGEIVKAGEIFGVSPAYLVGWSDHPGNAHHDAGAGEYVTPGSPVVSTRKGPVRLKNATDTTAFKAEHLKAREIPENKVLLISADDDAMAPLIQQGDELLIDRSQTTPKAADLFALVVDDRAWVRWIRPELDGETFTITAENADLYPPQHLTHEELSELDLLGRVSRIARAR